MSKKKIALKATKKETPKGDLPFELEHLKSLPKDTSGLGPNAPANWSDYNPDYMPYVRTVTGNAVPRYRAIDNGDGTFTEIKPKKEMVVLLDF